MENLSNTLGEAGGRVPADLGLVDAMDLQCDASMLTGESLPVKKHTSTAAHAGPADARQTTAFAGTVVTRGRGRGTVSATKGATEIGGIAEELGRRSISPLMIRLKRFSRLIAMAVGVAVTLLIVVGLLRGLGFRERFMMSVGLAVSAVPEELSLAISVALAIGMRRMAKAGGVARLLLDDGYRQDRNTDDDRTRSH
ncbi:P-type ATPase [Cupriavidus necator]